MNLGSSGPIIKCKIFEDNKSCIKIAKVTILTPRTKHLPLEYHIFRSHVEDGSISIEAIRTGEQNVEMLTKLTGEPKFSYLRKSATDIDLATGCWELKQDSIVFPNLSLPSHILSVIQSQFIAFNHFLTNFQSFKNVIKRRMIIILAV